MTLAWIIGWIGVIFVANGIGADSTPSFFAGAALVLLAVGIAGASDG